MLTLKIQWLSNCKKRLTKLLCNIYLKSLFTSVPFSVKSCQNTKIVGGIQILYYWICICKSGHRSLETIEIFLKNNLRNFKLKLITDWPF